MSLDSCRKKLEVFKISFFSLIEKKYIIWHAGGPVKPGLHAQELMLDMLAVRDQVMVLQLQTCRSQTSV